MMLAIAVAAPAFAAPEHWMDRQAEGAAPLQETMEAAVQEAGGLPPRARLGPMLPSGAPARLALGGTGTDRIRAQQCLTMAIYYEAAQESEAGQRAVAQVVLNRVTHPAYPSTVCGVVFQGSERATGCQFTFTCDGSLTRRPAQPWWNRASRIARAALAGADADTIGTATHYHTANVHPDWADMLQPMGRIGAHLFYRWPGAAGLPAAFTSLYSGREPVAAPHPRTPPILAEAKQGPEPLQGWAAPQPLTVEVAPGPDDMAQPSDDALPAASQARPEYARSGQWIRLP